jgi:predicted permease
VRMALGAGAGRLVRQFLTEAVLLSLLGGAVGIGLAFVGLGTLQRMGAGTLPRITEIGIDGTVLLFTLGAAVVTGLLFGLAPLLHLHSARAGAALKEGGLRTTGGRGRSRLRSLLVVSEMALAVVLVVGAGLLIRSLDSLHGVDPGFEPEGLLTFQVLLSSNSYPEAPEQMQFLDLLLDRVREIPGVQEAAVMSGLPPQREVNANDMDFEGLEATEDGPAHNVDYWQFVSRDYFEVMGIEIEEGRGFEGMDDSAGTPVVLINRRLADVFYPGENPIGRRIAPPQDSTVWFTIAGIARDVKQGGLSEPTGTEVYYHAPQTALGMGYIPREMNMVLRLDGDPGTILPQLRDAVWSLDPSLPLAGLETMEDHLGATLARPRFLTLVLTLFAGIALALAAVGTYGVISYGVAERNREIGIRMAMGAESGEVLGMILRGGSRLAAIGLLIGIAGALALSDLMESLLFGVSATDPVAFVLAPGVLALVALAACLIPARRATQVDPVNALKGE